MTKIFTPVSKLLLLSFLLLSSTIAQSQNVIEIVTNTDDFEYNDNGQWVSAVLGTPQADQITSVQTQVGVDAANMIWGGTASNPTLRHLFNLEGTGCVDSARFWIQGDDFVSDLSLNGTTIGSTTFGWTNFETDLIPVNLFLPGQNTLTISGDNSTGARRFVAMKVRIYLCSCSDPIANEIVTDVANWQYESNGQWINAELGTPQADQITSVQTQIGLDEPNMIWGGTDGTTSLQNEFTVVESSCIDSARFWIQGDDFVSDLSLNGTTIGSTPFGWTNFETDLVPVNLFTSGQNTLLLTGNNASGARKFVAMRMVIYTCGCSIATAISDVSENRNFEIWPNPANDVLELRYDDTDNSEITFELFNALGQREMVRSSATKEGSFRIDTDYLQSGIYYLKLLNKDAVIGTRKVIIQK